jgi:DNA repair protein RadC
LIHAGRIVGIDVVDHIILGDTEYCSLRQRKML